MVYRAGANGGKRVESVLGAPYFVVDHGRAGCLEGVDEVTRFLDQHH